MLTWLAFAEYFNSLGKLNIAIDKKVLEADSKLIHRYIKILTLSFFLNFLSFSTKKYFFFIWPVHNLNADKYSEFLILLLPLCMSVAASVMSHSLLLWPVALQARTREGVAMPSSRGILLTQGWNPHLLCCQWVLFHWVTWEALLLSLFANPALSKCGSDVRIWTKQKCNLKGKLLVSLSLSFFFLVGWADLRI